MGKINVLSFSVANLIAAGEVVDRPASVIKELMENAIDSGADRITVEIQNGGVVFMRVCDNGCGIERDDLEIAVRRHATSKIRNASDLDGIMTLGFRGEALAAIAAVSDLRIISRVHGNPSGACIEVSSGQVLGVTERGCSEGTSVIVENLFANVPARRKFLKRDVTETAAVHAVVEKVALSHPEISFTFITDGNIKLETAGDGKLINTIYALYGRDFTKSLIGVNYEYEGIHITGYTGRSDNVKPNRNAQHLFINGRLVKSKTVTAAIEQAYCSYMPAEKFPVCTLFVDINPKAVDVNVHPAKLEVKFSNEKPVFEAVYYAIKNALESNTTRPAIPPEKLSRISYTDYKEMIDQSNHSSVNNTGISCDKNKFQQENRPAKPFSASEVNQCRTKGKSSDTIISAHEEETYGKQNSDTCSDTTDPEKSDISSSQPQRPSDNENEYKYSAEGYLDYLKKSGYTFADCASYFNNQDIPEQNELIESQPSNELDSLFSPDTNSGKSSTGAPISDTQMEIDSPGQSYRIAGEIFNSYVIVELKDKMILIDKHAAHERIIFEQLKVGLKETVTNSQILMIPVEFMLASEEVMTINEYKEEIEKTGFKFESEKYNVRVSAVPESIELSAVPDIFMTMADRLKNNTGNAGLTRDIIFEKALYQASCKAAIKAGIEYGEEHIKWLVNKLMELPDITFCPHGRPVALEIKKSELDHQFKRT